MDKITYLAELAEGLARWVPERERQDILRYYAEYFEEAGPEREAEVVAELGDPWALSCRLAVEGGYVTWEKAASWRHKIKWPGVLIGAAVGLSVFALVFAIGLVATNVIWNSRSFAEIPVTSEAELVTVVDWDMPSVWGEFEIGYGYNDVYAMDYYFMDGENIAPFSSIDADISLGNIQVVAGDSFNLSFRRSEALGGYEPLYEIRDGVLRIRDGDLSRPTQVYVWDDLKKLFSADRLTVDVIVTLPAGTVLDKVSVKTGLGDVLLYGVNAANVTAETGLGNVECYEARNVGWMELTTGLGDVNLGMVEARDGLSIRLKSGMGNVEASLGCFENDCAYELESGLGLVTVNGDVRGSSAERKGNAPCQLNAESGTGGVNVYFLFD